VDSRTSVSDTRNSKHKGPEVGVCLARSRNKDWRSCGVQERAARGGGEGGWGGRFLSQGLVGCMKSGAWNGCSALWEDGELGVL
jgi:hypothetical protein